MMLFFLTMCLAWAMPSRIALAQGDGQGQVQLTLDLQGFAGPVNDLCFSPDGKFLAACGEKVVRIYEVRSGRLLKTLRGQAGAGYFGDCLAVTFSPDNCFFVVGIRNTTKAGSLRVYDTDNFHEIHELVPGHELPVTQLAFSHDGRYLVTADSKGELQVFDWPLRKIVGRTPPLDAKKPGYLALQFPVGELFMLASEFGGASVVSVPTGRRLGPDPRIPPRIIRWIDALPNVAYPEAGKLDAYDVRLDHDVWLAAGRGKSNYWVGCWYGAAAKPGLVYRQHTQPITALALNPDCDLVASADALGEIHLWHVDTGETKYVLSGVGQPIYRAALDLKTRRIGFATRPHQGKEWTYNRFGRIDHVFDFDRRGVFSATDQGFGDEVTQRGRASLQITHDSTKNSYGFRIADDAGQTRSLTLGAGIVPSSYTLLAAGLMGLKTPVVLGDYRGGIFAYDGATSRQRRNFVGHAAMVTSLVPSSDGKFLTSGSTDRTMRLWSLAAGKPTAWVGFDHALSAVIDVPAGSPAAKGDIRAGDRFVALDGWPLAELSKMQAEGKWPYRVGQRVTVAMERAGVGYEVEIPLVEGPDLAEPLLSLLVTDDQRWIAWTPQGYYDASPGAGDLVGFHVNRGASQAAQFLPVHQFRRQLYRPDVISEILTTSSVEEAVAEANEQFGDAGEQIDLRDSEAIAAAAPPQARILSPQDNTTTEKDTINVLAEVVSQDDRPITSVKLLVNGRPGMEPGTTIVAPDDAGRTRISFNKPVSLQPGENSISIIAANGSAVSVPMTITVVYDAPELVKRQKPKLHLLSIGVSNYANAKFNLRYAHVDAEKFADAWQGQRGEMYVDVSTKLVLNEEASAQGVQNAIAELLAGVERRDIAVIFISAHGVRDAKREYYLATHDIDPERLSDTAMHFSAITKLLEDLPCKVLMFVDTCHAEGITGAKGIVRDHLYELSSEEYGAVIFSSSLSREVSLEKDEWGHGAFTKAILDTFASRASDVDQDGFLSLSEMENRVYTLVQKMTAGQQTPVMTRPPSIPDLRFYHVGQP